MIPSLSPDEPFAKLTQEPRTLATLAAAARVCPHPVEATQALVDHQGLCWCTACGALGDRQDGDVVMWQRATIVNFITLDVLRQAHDLFCSLAELAHAAGQIARCLEGHKYFNSARTLAQGAEGLPKGFAADGDGLSSALLVLEGERALSLIPAPR